VTGCRVAQGSFVLETTATIKGTAQIIARAVVLVGEELSRYLECEGVRPAHFRRW